MMLSCKTKSGPTILIKRSGLMQPDKNQNDTTKTSIKRTKKQAPCGDS